MVQAFSWDNYPVAGAQEGSGAAQSAPAAPFNWDAHPEAAGAAPAGPQSLTAKALDAAGRILDYPGGFMRAGLAQVAGLVTGHVSDPVVKPADLAAAAKGEGPRSSEYLKRLGISEGPSVNLPILGKTSVRDVEGFGFDIATDPFAHALKAVKQLPYVSDLLSAAHESGLGQAVGDAAASAKEAAGNILAKTGEAITGGKVSADTIKQYASGAERIGRLAEENNNDIAAASNQVRDLFAASIDKTRSEMSGQISKALEGTEKNISLQPILDAFDEAKSAVNEKLYPEQIKQIDDIYMKAKSLAQGNVIPLDQAQDFKQYLQELATEAYRNPGEASIGSKAANGAKKVAAVTRSLINEAEPTIAEANNKLATLHGIEDGLNKRLITSGTQEAGLIAAGAGKNPQNALALTKLGEATGTDMLSQAKDLSAMQSFNNPSLKGSPVAATLGGLAGGAMGGAPGVAAGAALGGAITSPFALKGAIDTARAVAAPVTSPAGQATLRQSVIHGASGVRAIQQNQPGQGQ